MTCKEFWDEGHLRFLREPIQKTFFHSLKKTSKKFVGVFLYAYLQLFTNF